MKEKSLEKQLDDLNFDITEALVERGRCCGPGDYPEWEKWHLKALELIKQRNKLVALLPAVTVSEDLA
jgi:hypothetical protein